ncbi:hypothetical protein EVA_00732, partial [gut metagenome]
MRDTLIDKLHESGIEVVTDSETAQRLLDEVNGRARLSAKQKRALETASLENNSRSLTVISSADGANVLKKLDTLATTLEKSPTQPKTFIGDLAKAIDAKKKGSSSQYATFETKNGDIVTIRIANHNASSKRMDDAGRDNAISIVISPKLNNGILNDGEAHIVEFFYDSIKLRKADGKPLAEIVRSIKQALYSGEYKDTTGIAERQEVNLPSNVKEHRVFHGSGAEFEEFDHSHMGEGEGLQAYGWGTYVTEVENIASKYAMRMRRSNKFKMFATYIGNVDVPSKILRQIRNGVVVEGSLEKYVAVQEEFVEYCKKNLSDYKETGKLSLFFNSVDDLIRNINEIEEVLAYCKKLRNEDFIIPVNGSHIYTVEIPEDNGTNYLYWDLPLSYENLIRITNGIVAEGWQITDDEMPTFEKDSKFITLSMQMKGKDVYAGLTDGMGEQKDASQFLSSIGFTGISYPAEYLSGGRKDGAKNYVIFNESDAKITDHVRFFRTANGEAYGFTIGGKIYIDPKIATAETPIHEYAHLWADALRKLNPKEWQNVVELMNGTSIWEEVKELYPELKTDDEIADEVLAHYSGRRGAERLREAQQKAASGNGNVFDKASAISAIERVKEALKRFWKATADWLGIHFTTAEEVADKVMADMLNGVNPTAVDGKHDNRKELIAVHNISEDKLEQALELGGFP